MNSTSQLSDLLDSLIFFSLINLAFQLLTYILTWFNCDSQHIARIIVELFTYLVGHYFKLSQIHIVKSISDRHLHFNPFWLPISV